MSLQQVRVPTLRWKSWNDLLNGEWKAKLIHLERGFITIMILAELPTNWVIEANIDST